MKKYLLLITLTLIISLASAVTWNVSLVDSYGDGWNGGTLTVYVNGVAVLTNITLASGAGPQLYPFEVVHGDGVTTLYTGGGWAYENEYYIYDHNGELVASQGAGGATPSSITVPIIVNAPTGGPGLVTNPLPTNGATNVSASGNLTWTFGADTETYDLWFGPAGAMVQVVTGATAGGTGSYSYSGLNYLASYNWRVVSHNSTRATTNGPLWSFVTQPSPGTVLIGTGTATTVLPVYAYYGYTYSQTYYLPSEIGTPGTITSIAYYWNGAATNPVSNNWTIYMGHSANTAFSSGNGWEMGLSQVFSGTVDCPAAAGWINIPLTTPFTYNGVTSLVVGVDENAPGYDYPYGYFLNTSDAAYRSICYYSDGTNPDPLVPPSGSLYTYFPNILMAITPPIAAPPAAPILTSPGPHAANVNPTGLAFNWSPDLINGGVPDTYDLFVALTSELPEPFNSDDFFGAAEPYEGVSPGFVPSFGFDYSTNYTWTVQANKAGYESAYTWPPSDFTTMADPSITAFPYIQNFETWPPVNWDLSGGTYSFSQYLDGTGNNWAMAGYWGWTSGNTAVMTTPPFNSANPLQLTFDWSHIYHASYPNDALTVLISNDMSTWNELWYKAQTDLNSDDGAGNVTPGTGVEALIPIPPAYIGSPFWIRFFGYSGYGPNLYIDNFKVSVPMEHDAGVVSIDVPGVVGPTPLTPMATVRNFGMNADSFNVNMTIGLGYNQTVSVSNLAPGAYQQVSFPSFTPVVGTVYSVDVQTQLGTDQYSGNDFMTHSMACLDLGAQVFADVAWSGGGTTGPAYFYLNNPGAITDLPDPTPWGTNFLAGADWINGGWYGYEYGAYNWWQIDTATGAGTDLGGGSVDITGIAYNPTNGVIYGSGTTDLYTVDPLTGATTYVGNYGVAGSLFISIAYNTTTNTLYGFDIATDALYTINPATGAATLVGGLGGDFNYAQDMAFDQNSGLLYLAGYTTTGALYWIDTNTGAASIIGPFQGGWEIDGFVIPYGGLQAPDVAIAADGTLSWGAVAGAGGYKIYGGADPYGTLSYLGSTTATSWLDPAFPQTMKFYKVTAVDTVTRGPVQIRYEGDVYRNIRNIRSTSPQTHLPVGAVRK